ncbi:hypothetical protein ACNSTU_15845 [Aquisalimonas sp. APHAB1-3]|uniref:hypothetical protein n=1 Tax=Aquisalimonas sp. APHAB1-3 TaxID=3402080 RepID=UPI003AAD3D16
MSEQSRPASRNRQDAEFERVDRHDDEISLYDLWDVLVRRFPVLVSVALLVVVAGFAYAMMQPVEHRYRSGLELPRVYHPESGLQTVIPRETAIATLEDVIIPSQRERLFGDRAGGAGAQVIERGGEHGLALETTSQPANANAVAALHEAIIAALDDRLASRYERWLAVSAEPFENRIAMYDEQIDVLQVQLDTLNERVEGADGVTTLVFAQQLGDLRREMTELRRHRVDAQSTLTAIRDASHGTEQLFVANESDSPVGTGRSLIVALSVVLGGMLGLFAAFLTEFVSNARARRV